MLEAYNATVAERAALGIPALPLTKDQTTELVKLLKNPPAGKEAELIDLITHRVPAGVDEAAKVKADIAEKKKKEHDAYLERKARREAQAKKQKEYDDKRYQLFSRHMFSLFGYGWMHRFHEYGSNDIKIPERLFDRLKKEIEEEEEAEWREEQESNKIEYEERAARDALRCEKMATLSEKEYEKWEDDYWSINMDEIDDWLDYTANDFSYGLRREDSRIREGKIWIEEKMKEGKIREISEGKFEYYP
jgi:hypothetical protein